MKGPEIPESIFFKSKTRGADEEVQLLRWPADRSLSPNPCEGARREQSPRNYPLIFTQSCYMSTLVGIIFTQNSNKCIKRITFTKNIKAKMILYEQTLHKM